MFRIARRTITKSIIYNDFTGIDWTPTSVVSIGSTFFNMTMHNDSIFGFNPDLHFRVVSTICVDRNGDFTVIDFKYSGYMNLRAFPFWHGSLHFAVEDGYAVRVITTDGKAYDNMINKSDVVVDYPLVMHNGIYLPSKFDNPCRDDIGQIRIFDDWQKPVNTVIRAIDPQVIYSYKYYECNLSIRDMRCEGCSVVDIRYPYECDNFIAEVLAGGNIIVYGMNRTPDEYQKSQQLWLIDARTYASYDIPMLVADSALYTTDLPVSTNA